MSFVLKTLSSVEKEFEIMILSLRLKMNFSIDYNTDNGQCDLKVKLNRKVFSHSPIGILQLQE